MKLDGDLDVYRRECTKSVMDKNGKDCLSCGSHMKMIIEICDIYYATPATGTTASIVELSVAEGV